MKKFFLFYCLMASAVLNAQELEVPTLKSKNISGEVTKVELSQYEYVKDRGLTLTQADIETYDGQGRLMSIDRTVSTGLKYLYTYTLSKKGRLNQVKIVNPTNNQTVRTTDYTYKKGVLVSITQVQGTVTTVRTYTYDKSKHLIGLKVEENGVLKGEETYLVDGQGRRTQVSQKLPTDEAARVVSTFTYAGEGNQEKKVEVRDVNNVKYEIETLKDLTTDRNLKETTKNLSNNQFGIKNFLFQDDEEGSWTKGEIIDNEFGRSRLVLRKIAYADGTVTGRTDLSLDDHRARYFRQNDQFQVVYNGRIVQTGAAENLTDTNDRLVYFSDSTAMIVLKGYDENSYQTSWHQAEIISHDKDAVVWLGKSSGVDVFMKGKKLIPGLSSGATFRNHKIGNSAVVYVAHTIKKSFIAGHFDSEENKGKLHIPELTEEHNYWGKASDTTYVLAGYGKYITINGQATDNEGNKLVKVKVDRNYWYSLKNFQDSFDSGKPGDVFPAIYLTNPLGEIREKGLFNADFNDLKHDNLKDNKYRLKASDEVTVSSLTEPTFKIDDELIAYLSLTNRYLKMDNYYSTPGDQDVLNQPVSVLMEGAPNAYFLYNEKKSIDFYARGRRMNRRKFSSHLMSEGTKQYGAVVYDSISNISYGMNYDLNGSDSMGPMTELGINPSKIYLLKLQNDSWVMFQRGLKISNYDYTGTEGGIAYYFFKGDKEGEVVAYQFEGYGKAEPGEFVSGKFLSGKKALELSEKFVVNPFKPLEEQKLPKGTPNTFKKDSTSYYLWDGEGETVVNYLTWYGSLGTEHAFVYDTIRHITYQLKNYTQKDFMEGEAKAIIGSNDITSMTWADKKVAFFIKGKPYQQVKRVYVENAEEAADWSELVYEPISGQTYLMKYPNSKGFYLGEGELLPLDNRQLVLIKSEGDDFVLVREGVVDKAQNFNTKTEGDDLIYWAEEEEGLVAYRFSGFQKGKNRDLFVPEPLSAKELEALKK